MSHPRYARSPSSQLRTLLASNGMLAPLLRSRTISGLRLDLHFREGDHLHAYCGLTRILDVALVGERLCLGAAHAYRNQSCAGGLFRDWVLNDPAFVSSLEHYLAGVTVDSRWTSREGAIQTAWGAVTMPWLQLDREAVIGYPSKKTQSDARNVSQVMAARSQIEMMQRAHKWAKLPKREHGAELDQLAIDPEGRLVLIELKYAKASSSSVFYAPLQLLQYVCEWHQALGSVRDDLEAIREARISVGLSPANIPQLSGALRPVLAFGAVDCSPKVAHRLDQVLDIVDQHLPLGVPSIEVWALHNGVAECRRSTKVAVKPQGKDILC